MKLRIQHVDPGQSALIVAGIALVQLVLFLIVMLVSGNLREEGGRLFMLSAVGVFAAGIGGFIYALLFNLVAPRVGGLTVRVEDVDAEVAAAPSGTASTPPEGDFLDAPAAPPGGPGGLKRCPSCQAEVAAARSFCPKCDHDFEPDPGDPDPAPKPAP